jgi:TIR domain
MIYDYFISYSSKDLEIASDICDKLEAEGLNCWIAPRNIDTGISFAKAIIDGIKSSHRLLLIYTKNADLSEQVLREVDRAVAFEKKILVFKLVVQKYSDSLDYYLCKADCIDATRGKYQQYIKEIQSKAPVRLVKKTIAPEKPTPPPKVMPSFNFDKKRIIKVFTYLMMVVFIIIGGLYFKNIFDDGNKENLEEASPTITKPIDNTISLPDNLYKQSSVKLYDEKVISRLSYEDLKILSRQIKGLGGEFLVNSRAGIVENQLSDMAKNNLDLIDHFIMIKLSESLPKNSCKKFCLSIAGNDLIKIKEFAALKELEQTLVKKYGIRAQKLYKTINQRLPDQCMESPSIPVLIGFKPALDKSVYIKVFGPIGTYKSNIPENADVKLELIETTAENSSIQVFFSSENGLVDIIRKYAAVLCKI